MKIFKFNCFLFKSKFILFFDCEITDEYILDLDKQLPTIQNSITILFNLNQNLCENIDVAVLACSKKEAKSKIKRWYNKFKQQSK